MRHGEPQPINTQTWLGPDPDLALVTADMNSWLQAHACPCVLFPPYDGAMCVCEDQAKRNVRPSETDRD